MFWLLERSRDSLQKDESLTSKLRLPLAPHVFASSHFSDPFTHQNMESCYIFRTWAGETLTIACAIGLVVSIAGILAVYDGKPVPDWGGDLNLNALIALLSTVLRALLVVTVAQIISQRKWDWFSVTSARPLSDIQRFDYGSRGAYGALLLIPTVFLKDFVTLAAAVVLLLSFLVGPFAQQANGAAPCSFPSATLNASLPFAHTVPGSGGYIPFTGGSDGGPTTDLVAAILSSVVSPYGIENKIRTSCPTGNCTFSNLGPRPELEKAFFDSNQSMHSTVGVCNICTNVASLVTSKIESTEWSNDTVHSLPSGLNRSVGAGHFEVSTMKPTPNLTWMGSLLTDSIQMGLRQRNPPQHRQYPHHRISMQLIPMHTHLQKLHQRLRAPRMGSPLLSHAPPNRRRPPRRTRPAQLPKQPLQHGIRIHNKTRAVPRRSLDAIQRRFHPRRHRNSGTAALRLHA